MSLIERLLPHELFESGNEYSLPGRELEQLEKLAHYPLPVLLGFASRLAEGSASPPVRRATILELSSSTYETLIDLCRQSSSYHDRFELMAPSLRSLSQIADDQSIELEALLRELSALGILRLAGCPRTGFEKKAVLFGLIPTIELDASSLLDHLHLTSGPRDSEDNGEDLALLLLRFAAQILELREELGADSRLCCRIVLGDKRLTLKTPTASPLVRAVALIRAVLPEENLEIEAAPALFGNHLSVLLAGLGLISPGSTYYGGGSTYSA